MKKNLKFTNFNVWLRLIIISLVILILGATSCDLLFPKSGQNLNKFIETYWGIDVTNSAQVSGMILAMQTMGNKEAVNGLTAYAHCRSELYQERGDKLFLQGETDGARAQYVEAIKWGTTNTQHRASDKAMIYFAFANTYIKDAADESNASKRWPLYRASGQNTLIAAKTEPVPEYKAYYYREAAYRLAAGGDKKNGKKAYEEAARLQPNSVELIALDGFFKE
jgi:hypothetical protein